MTSNTNPDIAFNTSTSKLTSNSKLNTKETKELDVNESNTDIESQEDENRLRGGATLPDEEDEDEAAQPAQPAQVEERTQKFQLKSALPILKIAVLFVFWIVNFVCLMISKEHSHEENVVAVEPNKENTYFINELEFRDNIGVSLMGPFVVAEDLQTGMDENAKYLNVFIRRIFYDDKRDISESKTVSDTFTIELSNKTDQVLKKHVFKVKRDEGENTQNTELYFVYSSNEVKTITFNAILDEMPINELWGIIYGTIILLGLYILIIWEIIHRTFAAMLCSLMALSVLGVLNARPTFDKIMGWLEVETMMLLFGMMILVAVLSESGVFDYLAVFAYRITHGRVWPLINCLCFFAAFLSTFLDNVTMMLLVTPVSIRLCEVLELDPMPILLCMVMFSNIGAALTPVGDPPNVIISTNPIMEENGINFGVFVLHMLPGVLLTFAAVYGQLRFMYRKHKDLSIKDTPEVEDLRHEIHVWERLAAGISALSKDEDDVRGIVMRKIENLRAKLIEITATQSSAKSFEETLGFLEAEYPLKNKPLLYKSGVAFAFVIGLFFVHSVPDFVNLTLGWIAFLGAMMLLILSDIKDMEAVLSRVEWSTLLFFASLFVLMECLAELGLIDVIGNFAVKLILGVNPDNQLLLAIVIILWTTSISAAFLDNIPVATMMLKIVISLANNKELQLPLQPLAWALAFGSCFGGNGTLIGASANVVCAGVAEQHGYKISFLDFFVVGFPVVLGSTTVATAYLLIAHCAFKWH